MKVETSRFWDLPAAGLLLAAVLTSVGRLGVTRWIPDLDYVQTLAVLGVLLGLALGLSRFPRRTVTGLALGYGLTLIPAQLVRVMDPDMSLGQRLLSVGGRLSFSLGEFSRGSPVEDPIFFLTLLAVVCWVIGLTAGYYLVRHANFLAATLPAGLLMLIVQAYDFYPPGRVWFLGFYIFLSLVLLERLNYRRSQAGWRERRVFFSPETSLDLTSGAAIAAAVIILAAWTVPGISSSPAAAKAWESLTEPWRVIRDRLGDAFAAAEGDVGVATEFFGENLALGTGSPLSQEVMFVVHLPAGQSGVPRYYWRGRVYDRYENRTWTSSATQSMTFDPADGNAPLPDLTGRLFVDFTFTVRGQQRTLYLPSQPLWISRRANAKLFSLPGGQVDVAYLRTPAIMQPGEVYQARGAVAVPTIARLRAAGEEYPEWVRSRYLQLPENFSPDVQDLARQITRDAATPYDRARAITDYLRREIEYTPSIPPPAAWRDPLEYFLFDLKRGFCNYYASAEVLMLRSVGVPARMVAGFAQGQADMSRTTFTVLQRDAHAWPEVYFPAIGWVEFEPTAGQEALVRPSGLDAEGGLGFQNPARPLSEDDGRFPGAERPGQEDVEAGVAEGPASAWQGALAVGLSLLGLLAALAGFWYLDRRHALLERLPLRLVQSLEQRQADVPGWLRSWAAYSQSGPTARAFEAVNLSLRWLGEPPPIHATPAQRGRVLADLMPEAASTIQTLVSEHQAALYSPRPADLGRVRRARLELWRHTLRTLIRRRVNSLRERF